MRRPLHAGEGIGLMFRSCERSLTRELHQVEDEQKSAGAVGDEHRRGSGGRFSQIDLSFNYLSDYDVVYVCARICKRAAECNSWNVLPSRKNDTEQNEKM